MKNTVIRNSNDGRILGGMELQWYNLDDEHWQDQKVKNVRFPEHKGNLNGECITYNIKDLK